MMLLATRSRRNVPAVGASGLVLRLIVSVLALMALFPASASAQTVYEQQPAHLGGFFSDGSTIIVADEIRITTPITIEAITWWGGYGSTETAPDVDNFTIRIVADNDGVPGSVIATFSAGGAGRTATEDWVNRPDPDTSFPGRPEYVYTYRLPEPLTITPGTRPWIIIINTPSSDIWFWEGSTSANPGLQRSFDGGETWQRYVFYDAAFRFSGTAEGVLALQPIGDKTVNAREELSFSVNATGGGDRALTFSMVGLPDEATLTLSEGSNSRFFSWTPNSGEVGTYYPCFGVTDGQTTASQCPAITVLAGAYPDRDLDGVPDAVDNCPDVYNPNQSDLNNNGIGDACESAGFAGSASTATTVNNSPSSGFFTIGQPVVLHACVTFAPADPSKPTFVVRPDSSFVLIEVIDASGAHLPLTNMIERGLLRLPGDLVSITSTITLCTDVSVTDQFTLPPGTFTINAEYVTLGVKDPGVDKDNNCTEGADACFQPILQTKAPAGSKTVTVRDTKGSLSALDALIADVGRLSDQGMRGSLGAKLRAARASLLRGNIGATCNQLGAFNNEDAAQSGKKLDPAVATDFANRSNFIKVLLVCS